MIDRANPASIPTRRLSLIDGHYYIYRAHFAFGARPLTNSEGARTEAAYSIAQILLSMYRGATSASYWAVALDAPGPTFRDALYPDYKGHRLEMPPELVQQLPWIDELLAGFRVPRLSLVGYEADDMIASATEAAALLGFDVLVYSRDKDLEQLISDRVRVVKGLAADEVVGPAELVAKRGFAADQVVDYLALVGDASDNVPGVPGIGPKSALKILQSVRHVEELYTSASAKLPATLAQKIGPHIDALRLSRRLVELCRTAPLPPRFPECLRIVTPDLDALRPLFMRLGFSRLMREIETAAAVEIQAAPNGAEAGRAIVAPNASGESTAPMRMETPPAALDRDPVSPAPTPKLSQTQPGGYRLISSAMELDALFAACRVAKRFAFDTETTGLDPIADRAVGFSIAITAGEGWYIPLHQPTGELFLERAEILRRLQRLLEDSAILKIGHHLKYDAQILLSEGITLTGIGGDSMIEAYLLNPLGASYKLDTLVAERLHHRMIPIEELIGAGPAAEQRSMADLTPEQICDYAAEDADFTLRLHEMLSAEARAAGMARVLDELELPLVEVLVAMERHGVTLKLEELARLESDVRAAIVELEQKIYAAAGGPFDLNSPKQLQEVLFERLGLPAKRKTKTGHSTAAEVLEELVVECPDQVLPKLMLDYRSHAKLLGTYIEGLPRLLHPKTGRLHTDLRQTATATGRLSSHRPNLQNIPVKNELGRRIRKAFVPTQPDFVFLSADYSQIELRLLAHLSGDDNMQAALRQGQDIHTAVAARVFNKAPEQVVRAERSAAKAVNFGIIYGMGAFGLARDLGISQTDAQAFIDSFFRSFPGVKRYINEIIGGARERKEVRTIYGRRRPLPEMSSRLQRDQRQGERFAVNTVMQGSAADLLKHAMVAIHRRLRRTGSSTRLVLQIHDELLFEVARSQLASESKWIQEAMEGILPLAVPLVVNVASGEDWYEASK
ncbi:MAG: DNA polymerase I [Planctomycetota bacterium]